MLLVSGLNAWSLNTSLSYGSGTSQEVKRQNAVTEIKVSPQMGKQTKKKPQGPKFSEWEEERKAREAPKIKQTAYIWS